MIMFDYICKKCGKTEERCVTEETRDTQVCEECNIPMAREINAKPEKAFTPHFSFALGEYITSRKHRQEVLTDIRERSYQCLPPEKRSINRRSI